MDEIEAKVLEFLDAYGAAVTHWSEWPVKERWWDRLSGPHDGMANITFRQGFAITPPHITHQQAQALLPSLTTDPLFSRVLVLWTKMAGRAHIQFRLSVAPKEQIAVVDTLTPAQLEEIRAGSKKGWEVS